MTKPEYWQAVVAKYPQMADPDHTVKLTARGLRRLVEQAFDEGWSHCNEGRRTPDDFGPTLASIFGPAFNKRKKP